VRVNYKLNIFDAPEDIANFSNHVFRMRSWEVQDLYLAVLSDLCFVNSFDNVTLSKGLLDYSSRRGFLLIGVLRNKVGVSAAELRGSWNWA
jgi:hypothetical protein